MLNQKRISSYNWKEGNIDYIKIDAWQTVKIIDIRGPGNSYLDLQL